MRTLLPIPLLFALFLQTASSQVVSNDFSSYPEGSQQCLYSQSTAADCVQGTSGADLNQCLCTNRGNFIYNSASCIAKTSPSDLGAVYDTLQANCAGTGVTLTVSKPAFLSAASAAIETTSTPTPTSTSTSTTSTASPTTPAEPSTSPATSDQPPIGPITSNQPLPVNGISTGAKIGIGVGSALGAVAILLAAWFIIYQRRRRRRRGQQLAQKVDTEEMNGGESGIGVFGMVANTPTTAPTHEYAQSNMHLSAAELAPSSWRPHSELGGDEVVEAPSPSPSPSPWRSSSSVYVSPGYAAGGYKDDKKAGEPLLAELEHRNRLPPQYAPVELAAD
ncbi:hypothetical protein GGR50DRAFT_691949 [Xylaria sp. CBS 124048]|nr:hypothetical protein GGR50DRAFT_691949 [Xylaria sp. CBS 124048]